MPGYEFDARSGCPSGQRIAYSLDHHPNLDRPQMPTVIDERSRYRYTERAPQYRVMEETWSRPQEVARFNDYRSPKRFDDPFQHLHQARELLRSHGIEFARREYMAAMRAADRIDQGTLQQDRVINWRQVVALTRQVTGLERSRAAQSQLEELYRRRDQAMAGETQYNELYLSPAIARANMAFAFISSGNPSYKLEGERFLDQALRLRPEIELDPNFQKHLHNAYRQGGYQRDLYDRGDPAGSRSADGPRSCDPALPAPRPADRPASPGSRQNDGPSVHPGSRSEKRSSTAPVQMAPPVMPVPTDRGPLSRGPTPSDQTQPGQMPAHTDRPGDRTPTGPGQQRSGGELRQPRAKDGPMPFDPLPEKRQSDSRKVDRDLAERLAAHGILTAILGYAGWKLVKKGREWYLERKKAREGDKPAVPAGEETGQDKPKDPKLNGAELAGRPASEQAASAREALGRISMSVEGNGHLRPIKIDGKEFKLVDYGDGWVYGKHPGSKSGPLKVHVSTDGPQDLARLQKALIPELLNDPLLKEKVSGWKTMDPLFAVGREKEAPADQNAPTGKGQGAKAFTIFVDHPQDGVAVQKRIDQILKEKALNLPKPIDSGNLDRIVGDSRRVGLVRDLYPATTDAQGRKGALVDDVLTDHIKAKLGMEPGHKLTDQQLEQAELDAHLRKGTLTYDQTGQHLMLIGVDGSFQLQNKKPLYYLSEMYGERDPAKGLTNRPAMYALAEKYLPAGSDPSDLARGAVPGPKPGSLVATQADAKGQPAHTQAGERISEPARSGDSRILPVRSGHDPAQLARDAAALETAVNDSSLTTSDPFARRSFMDAYVTRAKQFQMPAESGQKADALTRLIKGYFAGSKDSGGLASTDPAIQRVQVVASSELNGNRATGGRLVFKHGSETFVPISREGNDFVVSAAEGSVKRIPVAEATIELQIPADKLSRADRGSDAGRWITGEIQATLYHQLEILNQLKTQAARAVKEGTPIETVKSADKAVADRSAEFVQFQLNDRRLAPDQEPAHTQTSGLNSGKPVELSSGKDVVTRFHPDGRIEVVERGKLRELNEAERDKVINDAFEDLIRTAKEAKDADRLKELEAAREEYRSNPVARQTLLEGIGREMGGARARLGTGVGILIVVSTALGLYLANHKSAGYKPPERAPISAK